MGFISGQTGNLLQLSLGLMLIFLAFFTQSFIEETVLENRSKEDASIAWNAGYISQTIIYGTFLFANLIAPPIVAFLGCRWSLLIGSLTYTSLMAGFLVLNTPLLYITSALEGFGSGILWTAVGHYLALNSNEHNVGRNSSIMWIMHTSGLIFGGIFLLAVFGSKPDSDIDMSTTRLLYGGFTLIALVGNGVFFFVRTPKEEQDYQKQAGSYTQELVSTFKMLFTVDMALLSVTSAFAGQEMSFWSGVYPNSLSFTKAFPLNTKTLVAYNSIAAGVGEITGSLLFGIYGSRTERFGRWPIMAFSSTLACIAFILTFLNLPPDSPYEESVATSYIQPSIPIALSCGAVFGLMDAAVNTQIYSLATVAYRHATPQAFAISKFFHALASTICMYYGGVLQLEWQLLLLAIGAILSAFTFFLAEKRFLARQRLEAEDKMIVHKMDSDESLELERRSIVEKTALDD